jgi:hypothetical protein
VRSRPGSARTILRFHTISARPTKQPLMVRTFLQVYGARLLFLFLQEQLKDIIICQGGLGVSLGRRLALTSGVPVRFRWHSTNGGF